MATKINVRSPYYIKRTYTSVPTLNYATMDLYIWEGNNLAYVDDIDSIQSRTYAGTYVSLVFGGTTVDVTVNDPLYAGYAGFQFQVTPTSGTYIVEVYKDGVLFKTHDNITVDGSGYFSVTTIQMTTGTYTFKLYYNDNPTTATFTQLSGGYKLASSWTGGAGFTNTATSISQTISYTENVGGSAKYTLTKTELNDGDFVVFEISELIRDYLVTEYGDYSTEIVWVKADITAYAADGSSLGNVVYDYLAMDGYGYFEDGINPANDSQLLQSNTTVYYNEGEDIVLAVWAEDNPYITFQTGAGTSIRWDVIDEYWETTSLNWGYGDTAIQVLDSTDSANKIVYVRLSGSEFFESNDTITIEKGIGGAGGDAIVVTLKEVCEPKYTPLNVIFFNKFGALQNMWFFKKSVTSLNTTSESYKSNILDFSTLTYSTTSPQIQKFNANGTESITLNSGFYDEDNNELVRQLLLSENVWIDNGTQVLPVNLNTNSYTFKTSVNDKLIQHTLDFEYAFDKINSIR